MVFPLLFLLPVAALIALIVLGKAHWASRRARWMVWGSLLTAGCTGAGYLWAIFHSTSSTAAIGVIFIPIMMAIAAPVGALLGVMTYEVRFHTRSVAGAVSLVGLVVVAVAAGQTGLHVAEFHGLRAETDPGALGRAASAKLAERDYFTLAAIAANPHTPRASLLEIASYDDPGLHEKRSGWVNSIDKDQLAVVRKVIRNPNAPVEALRKLAESKNEYVLGDVAQERRTPEDLLRALAARRHGYLVNWGLAANPSVPAEILQQLPYETDKGVAQFLAYNSSTPVPVLEKLAAHPDAIVRSAVAGNGSTPESVLRGLMQDKAEWVARQAGAQLKNRR